MASPTRLVASVLLASLLLAGCVAPAAEEPVEGAEDAGTIVPIELPAVIAGFEHAAHVDIGSANDVAFLGNLAFVSGRGGSHVIDVSDPREPVLLSSVECRGIDVGVVDLGARVLMTISSQFDDACPGATSSGGIRLVDVTDPASPVVMQQVALRFGSHTHTPYGDSGLIYNSAYSLVNPFAHHRSEIVDVSDPENATVVGEFLFPLGSLSHGCHDILAEPARERAVCAGITETMLWDTSNPLSPSVVATIRNPLLNIHHSAATARDGNLLILGDEFGGAAGPGCNGVLPTGALWFYDISDFADPRLLGYFPPPPGNRPVPCTAHNFNVVDGHDLVVAAFYSAGTILVDFSDPANPRMVDQFAPPDTSAWASYYHDGAIYVGDGGRGFDSLVFR